jgi:hypothetical protein
LESVATQQAKYLEPELLGGQVPLESVFYVERSPLEADCYKTILQPGALIRIKAPRQSEQVQDLAWRHGLDWSAQQVEQLMALVGGHPDLVRLALDRIWRQHVTL